MTADVPVTYFDTIDSTNAEARRQAEAGEAGPHWYAASRQTAGRGRRGRAWESPTGNLAATLLVTTDLPLTQAAQISFVAAVSVAEALNQWIAPERVRVKWPNDVMIDATKVCGILVESGKAPGGGHWVAIGIGVNLAVPPEVSERPATALALHMDGPPPSMEEALEVLAETMDAWIGVWDEVGFVAIADLWTARAYRLGEACQVRLTEQTLHGVAEGLDSDGALRLRLEDGSVRQITAGDVFFGEA